MTYRSSHTGAEIDQGIAKVKGDGPIAVQHGGTGRTDLNTFMFYRAFLDINSNIDEIVEYGCYAVGGTPNLPTNPYGTLLVIGGSAYREQIYFCNNSTGRYEIWHRSTANKGATWSDWLKCFDSNDTIPQKNGGTGNTSLAAAVQALINSGEIVIP